MRHRCVVLVAIVLAAAACLGLTSVEKGPPRRVKVVGVYDGDTITVEDEGVKHKCRLLGIDAPELSYRSLWSEMDKVSKYTPLDARRELHEAQSVFRTQAQVVEAHGKAARDALADLIQGRIVGLEYDANGPTRDRYGRLLVYVNIAEMDVNAEMIRRGLAVADTRFPCDRLEDYVKLWRTSQASRVGLWKLPTKDAQIPSAQLTEHGM